MKDSRVLIFAVMLLSLVFLAMAANGLCQNSTKIQISGHQVTYVSGTTVYSEALLDERWVGRYWNASGQAEASSQPWMDDAFEISIKVASTPSTMSGTSLSGGWKWVSASELSTKTDRSGRHAVVELLNSLLPIKLKIHTMLDGTPVITRWLEIENDSSKSAAVKEISPWVGRLWAADALIRLGHSLRYEVPWEGWMGWKELGPGSTVIRNDTDRLWDDPYFLLQNESNGEYFFGQLAWAANYQMEFDKERGLKFSIGPVARQSLRVIAPHETVTTPAVHLGYVKGDFDTAVQAMHDHLRRSVLPTRKPERDYRSQYLFPEDQRWSVLHGDDYNVANLRKCVDVAAAAGIEVFIVDGPTWISAYGNWLSPKKKWFPDGLGPLADYIHQKGMLFGAYFETEGGRDGNTSFIWDGGALAGLWKESKVYQEHPEWFDNMNLNLAIPEAAAYLEEELGRIIEFYGLDLYRHDQNGIVFFPPGPGGGQSLRVGRFIDSNYWRHYEALNRVFEHVHVKYPDVILQSAAAGNFRLDLGTVGVFHEHFASDRASWPEVYRMISGMSVYLPPEILLASNGMAGPGQPDQVTMLRCAYAMGNTPMIFNAMLPKSLEEFKPEEQKRFRHYANFYKNFIRPIIAVSKVYHHAPVNATGGVESGDWFAMEFTSPDKTRGWATIVSLSKDRSGSYLLKPKGLDGSRQYKVTFDNTGQAKIMNAATLMREGVRFQPTEQLASELLLFEAQ